MKTKGRSREAGRANAFRGESHRSYASFLG